MVNLEVFVCSTEEYVALLWWAFIGCRQGNDCLLVLVTALAGGGTLSEAIAVVMVQVPSGPIPLRFSPTCSPPPTVSLHCLTTPLPCKSPTCVSSIHVTETARTQTIHAGGEPSRSSPFVCPCRYGLLLKSHISGSLKPEGLSPCMSLFTLLHFLKSMSSCQTLPPMFLKIPRLPLMTSLPLRPALVPLPIPPPRAATAR